MSQSQQKEMNQKQEEKNQSKCKIEDEFQSSKNEFLTTTLQQSLAKSLSQQNNLHKQNIIKKENFIQQRFTISIQYLFAYDPEKDITKIKRVRNRIREERLQKFRSLSKNSNLSSNINQKPFVEIYQPKNQQHQVQFKLYNQQKRKKAHIPGPGSYNIAKPFGEPVYETIAKNDDIILVKINNYQGTSSFKSDNKKLNAIYDKQKLANPGPGYYELNKEQLLRKRNITNRSKLDQYSKNYESNYKFIFQVFHSQHHTVQSIPNYNLTASSIGPAYHGKPQKLLNFQFKSPKNITNSSNQSINKLYGNDRKSHFKAEIQRQKSISQIIDYEKKNYQEDHQIFPIKTVDEQKLKQNKLKINAQFSENIRPIQIQNQTIFEIQNHKNIKQKLKLLIKPSLVDEKKLLKMNRKQQLYNRAGYYDGSQNQKLYTKYNVKTEKGNQMLKKILQPLPQRQKKFQSLDVNNKTGPNLNKFSLSTINNDRYDKNMISLFLNKNYQLQKQPFYLPFQKKQNKRSSYSSIQYH